MAKYRARAGAGARASASASIGAYSSRLKGMKERTGRTSGRGLKTGSASRRRTSRSTRRSTGATFAPPTITSSGMGGPFGAGAQQRSRQESYDRQKEKEFLDAKYRRTSQPTNIPEGTLGNYGYDDPMIQEAIRAVEEAKWKQEESKRSALGYYQPIQEALSQIQPEIISPGQMSQMKTTRRAELGAYGQNLASMHTDPHSGVQAGQRRQIGMGIAGRQANLPIELGLEVGRANRQAQLGLYGAQAGVAGGMAGIQMAYQYDPGMEYLTQLGYGAGYEGGRTGGWQPGQPPGAMPGSPQSPIGRPWRPGDPLSALPAPSQPGRQGLDYAGGHPGSLPPNMRPAGYQERQVLGGSTLRPGSHAAKLKERSRRKEEEYRRKGYRRDY